MNKLGEWPGRTLNTLKRLGETSLLMAVQPEEWKELKLTVDSGAGESVIPTTEATNVPLEDGDRIGCKYEVANGEIIRNKGQRRCAVVTRDCNPPKMLKLQVSDVNKGLLSVIELVKSGHRVVFDQEWSYIMDKESGKCDTIDQTEDTFELTTWVKSAGSPSEKGFPGQGR